MRAGVEMLGVGLSLWNAALMGDSYEPEAAALFARMTTQPDAARKTAIDTLIKALKTAGIWSVLDTFYWLAAHNAQASLLNWIDASYDLVIAGTPAFVADRGYTGNGVNAYLNTVFNPSTASGKYAQNDASVFVGIANARSSGDGNFYAIGARHDSGSGTWIAPRNNGNTSYGRVNYTASLQIIGDSNTKQL